MEIDYSSLFGAGFLLAIVIPVLVGLIGLFITYWVIRSAVRGGMRGALLPVVARERGADRAAGARDYLRDALPGGSTVYTLADTDETDQYGRAGNSDLGLLSMLVGPFC